MLSLLEAKTYKLFLAKTGSVSGEIQVGEQGRHNKAELLECQVFLFSWYFSLSENYIVNNLDMFCYGAFYLYVNFSTVFSIAYFVKRQWLNKV